MVHDGNQYHKGGKNLSEDTIPSLPWLANLLVSFNFSYSVSWTFSPSLEDALMASTKLVSAVHQAPGHWKKFS